MYRNEDKRFDFTLKWKIYYFFKIKKKKRTTFHIFTPNTQKTSNWTWKQKHSTLYKCSLEVLCNLGFKSSITKSNKTRVLALINTMTTSTKIRVQGYYLIESMVDNDSKQPANPSSPQKWKELLSLLNERNHNSKNITKDIPSHYSRIHLPPSFPVQRRTFKSY